MKRHAAPLLVLSLALLAAFCDDRRPEDIAESPASATVDDDDARADSTPQPTDSIDLNEDSFAGDPDPAEEW